MNKTVVIIDGDLVAYRFAAGGEARHIDVTHINSNKTKRFNTRTEFKKFLADKNFAYNEQDYLIVDGQTPIEFEDVARNVRKFINNVMDFTWADKLEVYVGSPNNTFRHRLLLPTPYKGGRSEVKPTHLAATKAYLEKRFNAIMCDSELEADDVITIRAYEELAKGNKPLLVTIDKDAMQCVGVDVLRWIDVPWKVVTIQDPGDVTKVDSQWKGTGTKFLAFQTLAGDAVDAYCGYDLSKTRYGPGTAAKALNEHDSVDTILNRMVLEYKKLYPDVFVYTSWNGVEVEADWKDMLEMYWKCAYMKRSWKDESNVWEYLDANKVKYD